MPSSSGFSQALLQAWSACSSARCSAGVIVPGLVPHFFCGATAGVYGNITGGRRGAVVGAFAHGLLISFLPAILLPMMGDMGLGSTTFGDADFGVVGIVLGHIIAMFN